jgi:hypothetical protein
MGRIFEKDPEVVREKSENFIEGADSKSIE